MPDSSKLDPAGERAAATEAVETTPISGKEHEYRADGDHHPRQDAAQAQGGGVGATDTAPRPEVEAERRISDGIPGAGRTTDED